MDENYPDIRKHRAELDKCVTCGICHDVCPTYKLSDRELLSPRGRIVLLRRLLDGDIEPEEIGPDAFDFCTLCYACQTACPAGVKTDLLFIAARKTLADYNGIDKTKQLVFKTLEKPNRVALAVGAGSLAQKMLGRKAVDSIAGGMHVPKLRSKPTLRELPPVVPPADGGEPRYRVGFFIGCVANYVASAPALAAIEVLSRLGCEVVIPQAQVCCGAPAFNNGDYDTARRLAEVNLQLFRDAGIDYIVSPDATCGGAFSHEIPELAEELGDELWHLAHEMQEKTIDFPSFVLEHLDPQFDDTGAPPIEVTIHDSCHLTHTKG
ncbi:4Fe-4S dicluster domain-containing protein, partial [bacterium]|nr:4Fe-4S dicluster domain-containing protein [bacterium]